MAEIERICEHCANHHKHDETVSNDERVCERPSYVKFKSTIKYAAKALEPDFKEKIGFPGYSIDNVEWTLYEWDTNSVLCDELGFGRDKFHDLAIMIYENKEDKLNSRMEEGAA